MVVNAADNADTQIKECSTNKAHDKPMSVHTVKANSIRTVQTKDASRIRKFAAKNLEWVNNFGHFLKGIYVPETNNV